MSMVSHVPRSQGSLSSRDVLVNQYTITVADLPVFQLPAPGQLYIEDIRYSCIVSPGYPGNYQDGG